LQPICLPFEVKHLLRFKLTIQTYVCSIHHPTGRYSQQSYEAFTVSLKQEDGSWKKQPVPAQTVEQVVLMGNLKSQGMPLCMPWNWDCLFTIYLALGNIWQCFARSFPQWSAATGAVRSVSR
jgi:hypothetical protein